MTEENDLIFREVQRFSPWCYLLLVFVIVFSAVITLIAVPRQEAVTRILSITLPILFSVLFLLLKLETEVRSDGLYVRFFPFHIRYRKFTAEDLSEYYARTYRPILEYGGWGIKWGKRGKAYNASGNRGVQLVLKNNKRLLIGSQRPEELVDAISSLLKGT